jgi:metal-responsive CopG/Arc/MetJ family transcriptional regulator
MDSMKQKISVTVETNLVKWFNIRVETQKFRNLSHAVEVALMEYKKNHPEEE